MTELQEIIKKTLKLTVPASTGYYPLTCKVCNDHTQRAGFKFNSDGSIHYNCFRGKCTASCGYTPGEELGYRFRKVLKAYGVVLPVKLQQELSSLTETKKKVYDKDIYVPHHYNPVEIPKEYIAYNPSIHAEAKAFLAAKGLSDETDFYISVEMPAWLHIPFRFHDDVIGFQSICMRQKAYLNATHNTDLIWFPCGIIPEKPVVLESVIDAMSVPDGIAVLHSNVSKKQAYIIRETFPLLLPDRTGSKFLTAMDTYGWPMIVPPYKEKDANKALQKYGMLVLAEMLRDNIVDDYDTAEMKMKLWTQGYNGSDT